MENPRQETEIPQQAESADSTDTVVVSIFGRRREGVVPPPTSEEILEWRKIRPQVLQMLREWQSIRGTCPLAKEILGG